jgi:hypothetical protein
VSAIVPWSCRRHPRLHDGVPKWSLLEHVGTAKNLKWSIHHDATFPSLI